MWACPSHDAFTPSLRAPGGSYETTVWHPPLLTAKVNSQEKSIQLIQLINNNDITTDYPLPKMHGARRVSDYSVCFGACGIFA